MWSFICTCARRGRGFEQKRTPWVQGGMVGTSNYSFCMYFVMSTWLSLVKPFITAVKTFAMTTLKYFTVFFFMESLIGYLKIFPLEMRKGVVWV